jgi:hypothetical protein
MNVSPLVAAVRTPTVVPQLQFMDEARGLHFLPQAAAPRWEKVWNELFLR